MPSTALKSLYGGKAALSGNVGGQKREQTVLTPPWLLAELATTAGMYIGLDPCTTAENPTSAKRFCTGDGTPGMDGLAVSWTQAARDTHGFVYVNPPFDSLEKWMWTATMEATRKCPIYLLCPFRPHRVWFNEYVAAAKAEVCSIAPLAFVGSKTGFPAPLCIITYNLPSPRHIKMPMAKGTKPLVTGVWRNGQ